MIARFYVAAILFGPAAIAQTPTPAAPSAATRLAFEVVSIRPAAHPTKGRVMWATTPDGYNVNGQSIFSTIMLAYFPQGNIYWTNDRLSGAPVWLSDQYDIKAKVSEVDLADWQKQGVTLDKKPMLRVMLQSMLADRFHLVAHMVPGPSIAGWSLEVGKHAPHLTEAKPDEILPAGLKLPDGGVSTPYQLGDQPRITLYGATIADLAQMLAQYAGQPVQDHSGLSGHYDFRVDWIPYPDSKLNFAYRNPNDTDPLSRWDLNALGLRYIPAKIPTEVLVIDHIEKPSEN